MKIHLVVPALNWPDINQLQVYHDLALPHLEKLLAKSNQSSQPSDGIEAWLCQVFNITKQQNWPVAPISLLADCVDKDKTDKDCWIRADPIHLRIEHNHLMLADSHAFQITQEEAQVLTNDINCSFKHEGWALYPFHPKRWYIRLQEPPEIETYSLMQVTCKNINNYLPAGKENITWHKRFNEIQMLLHEHPLNKEREARGELAVNSVWFWGSGYLPESIQTAYTKIWGGNELVYALSRLSGIPHSQLPDEASVSQFSGASENHLIMLDTLLSSAQYRDAYHWRESLIRLEQTWFAPLYDALKRGVVDQLTITALNETQNQDYVINRASLWRFWVGTKPLSFYGEKPQD